MATVINGYLLYQWLKGSCMYKILKLAEASAICLHSNCSSILHPLCFTMVIKTVLFFYPVEISFKILICPWCQWDTFVPAPPQNYRYIPLIHSELFSSIWFCSGWIHQDLHWRSDDKSIQMAFRKALYLSVSQRKTACLDSPQLLILSFYEFISLSISWILYTRKVQQFVSEFIAFSFLTPCHLSFTTQGEKVQHTFSLHWTSEPQNHLVTSIYHWPFWIAHHTVLGFYRLKTDAEKILRN